MRTGGCYCGAGLTSSQYDSGPLSGGGFDHQVQLCLIDSSFV
jgi:hypothetical protein